VDDLIEAMMRVMSTPDEFTGPINIGNPCECTILELAKHVIEVTGSSSRLIFKPLPTDDPRQRKPDISLANEVLGWKPTIELKVGLERTARYFERLLKSIHAEWDRQGLHGLLVATR
jgi:UDP-glucuronate decarboxylase